MKKVSQLNTKFQDSFQHVCIIASPCVLYLKFYWFFCFCHRSLFNVSLLYLFINVFTRHLSKTWWKRCYNLTQNSNIQFNMYVSLHHHLFLYLTFMYLSIPSSLLEKGTANTWWILLHNVGRADIEGSQSNVTMNACPATQAWFSLWVMGR